MFLEGLVLLGDTTLTLQDPVSWIAGDSIVIASPDFGATTDYRQLSSNASLQWSAGYPPFPEQTETRVIARFLLLFGDGDSVAGNVVTLTRALSFMHWGVGFECAEVG